MRERAIATIGVWTAVVLSIVALLNSLTVQVFVPVTYDMVSIDGTVRTVTNLMQQQEFVGGDWQFIAAGLIFGLIIGAAFSTRAIWRNAIEQRTARQDAKIKREEQARAAYALDDAADGEIAALEAERYARLNDDGEMYARR